MGAPLIEESKAEDDLWNDPDMVQPPVVSNDGEEGEEGSGAYDFKPHLNIS